jgi:hypothetical protein
MKAQHHASPIYAVDRFPLGQQAEDSDMDTFMTNTTKSVDRSSRPAAEPAKHPTRPDDGLMARYAILKARVVERREPFAEFVRMMETETAWLEGPASTRFHLNRESGLLEHSVGVTETLLRLRAALAPEVSEESCVIVGLFHDAGKVGMPGKPYYLRNENRWEVERRNMTYRVNEAVVAMGVAVRSLYLVAKYLPLSDAEAQAIAYHDGQYVAENRAVAHKEELLTLLLQWADCWTAHALESGKAAAPNCDRYEHRSAARTFEYGPGRTVTRFAAE